MSQTVSANCEHQITKNQPNGGGVGERVSMRVTSLRFLLSALVVVIHNNFNAAHNAELLAGERLANDFVFHSSAFSKWLQFFISDGLGQAAVPVFFIISAYLQFKKNDFYGKLLKKKTKSLAVPVFFMVGATDAYHNAGYVYAAR